MIDISEVVDALAPSGVFRVANLVAPQAVVGTAIDTATADSPEVAATVLWFDALRLAVSPGDLAHDALVVLSAMEHWLPMVARRARRELVKADWLEPAAA